MAVMAREAWTDERLDDLKGAVDGGFRDMREEFRAVRDEISAVRGEVGAVRGEVAALQRAMLQMFVGTMATMIIGFLGVIATVLTQT
jgi:hypothetical protein